MRSCERPRKRSTSETLPSSVSKRYSLWIRTQGSSCRRRASSSLRRVSSFSALSSSSRAASHSSRVPVLWSVIVSLLPCRYNSLARPAPLMTLPAPLANSVDQAYTPILKLLNLPQFKPTTTFRRRKERLPYTGDKRINNKPKFIHQPGIDKARRSSSTPDEINVFAGLLLEGSDFFESPDEARLRPESRGQGAR